MTSQVANFLDFVLSRAAITLADTMKPGKYQRVARGAGPPTQVSKRVANIVTSNIDRCMRQMWSRSASPAGSPGLHRDHPDRRRRRPRERNRSPGQDHDQGWLVTKLCQVDCAAVRDLANAPKG